MFFFDNGLRELKITSRIAQDSLRHVRIAVNMLTGGLRTASRWLQEPSEPPKTPLREAKILKTHYKKQCFFALWFLRCKRALEAQYGPQMAQERAPRRAPERPKTCPRALKSAPSAAQEAYKTRFFF